MRVPPSPLDRQFLSLLLLAGVAAEAAAAPNVPAANAATTPRGYQEVAQPFIERNCLECHGEKKAKAGFRIDLLGADFAGAKVADQWKEVIDRINAGEMPPEGKTRPDTRQAGAFVAWVNGQLHEMELAAKNAGGRIPMRRLNRDEYANTVRDLLKLDENIVRPLVEEMPADGKAEGFDRLGVALFFDQTQIERSLGVAANIAAKAIVSEPPQANHLLNTFGDLRHRPPKDTVEVFPAFEHQIPRGAADLFVRPEYIEYLQGYPTYNKELAAWGVINHYAVSKVVTQDGYYRIRIKAKVDNRARKEPNKFRLQYGLNSPIQAEVEVPLDPSGTTEAMMFLRGPVNGEVKGPQVFNLLWNHTDKAVINEPAYQKLVSNWTRIRGAMEQAAVKRVPEAQMDALKKERAVAEKALNDWTGPAHIYNPAMKVEDLPRLQIESIDIEGPVQKEWPPESHKVLYLTGDEKRDAAGVREIFARFLPRAYRRPVSAQEVDEIVTVVNEAQTKGKMTFPAAMRIGLQRVLCAPGFLFLQEPAGANPQRRRLTDYELASRLSYFFWSTMPDDILFTLATAGKLHEPANLAAQVKRMIADPKAGQLVQNFAGQWLSVRDFGSIQPAADYTEYDKGLERAARQEPFAFFTEVLAKNLPITSFINSDFLVVNERLAKFYGIAGVTAPARESSRRRARHVWADDLPRRWHPDAADAARIVGAARAL